MTDHESPAQSPPGDSATASPAPPHADPAAGAHAARAEAPSEATAPSADNGSSPVEGPNPEGPAAHEPGAAAPPHGDAEGESLGEREVEDAADSAGSAETEAEPAEGAVKEEPEPPREDPRIRLLQMEVAKKDELLREYIRAHKKAQAEWDAYRARLKRDEAAHVEAARGRAVEVFLDVGDDMERSLAAARQGSTVESLLEGLELVHRRFFRALEELGLKKHDPTGELFNPETMEAIGVIPVTDGAQDGKVVHTLRVGYKLGDRELRPAVVQVGRKA